jgi:hypothetical protein
LNKVFVQRERYGFSGKVLSAHIAFGIAGTAAISKCLPSKTVGTAILPLACLFCGTVYSLAVGMPMVGRRRLETGFLIVAFAFCAVQLQSIALLFLPCK